MSETRENKAFVPHMKTLKIRPKAIPTDPARQRYKALQPIITELMKQDYAALFISFLATFKTQQLAVSYINGRRMALLKWFQAQGLSQALELWSAGKNRPQWPAEEITFGADVSTRYLSRLSKGRPMFLQKSRGKAKQDGRPLLRRLR